MKRLNHFFSFVCEFPKLKAKYEALVEENKQMASEISNYKVITESLQDTVSDLNFECEELASSVYQIKKDYEKYKEVIKHLMPKQMSDEQIKEFYYTMAPICDKQGFELFSAAKSTKEIDNLNILYVEVGDTWKLIEGDNNRWKADSDDVCKYQTDSSINENADKYKESLGNIYRSALVRMGLLEKDQII